MPSPNRRFPPPWSVNEADSKLDRRSFIVRDANGQALAYVYFGDSRDGARRPSCSRTMRPGGSSPTSHEIEHDDRTFSGFNFSVASEKFRQLAVGTKP